MTKPTKLFWLVTIVTIGWIVFMRPYTPKNIVQFELAKTIPTASQIISTWGEAGVSLAKTGIYFDFIFIALYSGAIMLGCRVSAQFSTKAAFIKIGSILTWLIWVAGLFDIVENFAMLKTLDEVSQQSISIAFYFATIKFSIVLIALLFITTSTIIGLVNYKEIRQSRNPKNPNPTSPR